MRHCKSFQPAPNDQLLLPLGGIGVHLDRLLEILGLTSPTIIRDADIRRISRLHGTGIISRNSAVAWRPKSQHHQRLFPAIPIPEVERIHRGGQRDRAEVVEGVGEGYDGLDTSEDLFLISILTGLKYHTEKKEFHHAVENFIFHCTGVVNRWRTKEGMEN